MPINTPRPSSVTRSTLHPLLKTLELVETGGGGGKQNSSNLFGPRLGKSGRHGCLQALHDSIGNIVQIKGGRECFGVLADQKGFFHTREIWRQRCDATGFRNATGDPDEVVIAPHRPGRRIGIGGLAVIDKRYATDLGNRLLPVRQARIAGNALRNRGLGHTQRPRHFGRREGVLRIMLAR
jgi:hypothetical protein